MLDIEEKAVRKVVEHNEATELEVEPAVRNEPRINASRYRSKKGFRRSRSARSMIVIRLSSDGEVSIALRNV